MLGLPSNLFVPFNISSISGASGEMIQTPKRWKTQKTNPAKHLGYPDNWQLDYSTGDGKNISIFAAITRDNSKNTYSIHRMNGVFISLLNPIIKKKQLQYIHVTKKYAINLGYLPSKYQQFRWHLSHKNRSHGWMAAPSGWWTLPDPTSSETRLPIGMAAVSSGS